MLNGTTSPTPTPDNKDEASFIGGAELTEIPWLRAQQQQQSANGSHSPYLSGQNTHTRPSDLRTQSTSVIDGPNGAGSVETVTVNINGVAHSAHAHSTSSNQASPPNAEEEEEEEEEEEVEERGITQGELLRQEQEAGIVPVPSATPNARITRSSAAATAAATRAVMGEGEAVFGGGEGEDHGMGGVGVGDEEHVHARGPDVIGMEDMGPQARGSGLEGGLELEGPLGGRRGEVERREVGFERGSGGVGGGDDGNNDGEREGEKDGDGDGDGDGDVVVADADEVAESEGRPAVKVGDERGPEAVDTPAL